MVEIGKLNKLKVKEKATFGYNLDGENLGDILLLNKQVKGTISPGDIVEAFVYMDSDEKLLATMNKPKAMVGQFAYLNVVTVNKVGAFLDLGLAKDFIEMYGIKTTKPIMLEIFLFVLKYYWKLPNRKIYFLATFC